MKVYRGFDKEVGPISYTHWTYVTENKEQAKWYATKDGSVEDGAIIEYDMDKEHMSWITLSKINSFAENDSEYYEEEDLLWYQEELAYSLYKYVDGIIFQDPYSKKPHTIYIILKEECLKNGRILSKEEFDSIQLNESYYVNEVNEVLRLAGVQLNESEDLTGYNRIAGFWNYAKEEFNYFPRTTEELDPNDDEIVQYIHNNPSKDYFTEQKVVRFGIEDIPGEGVVCYIEGDTKRHVEKCYYAIIDKHQEECDIIKYELEYYVGKDKRMDEYDAYGNQIMEDVDRLDEKVVSVDKELSDTKLVTSEYEMKQYINSHIPIRIVYDNVNDWYLVNDANKATHSAILDDAISAGLYNEEGVRCANDLMYTERHVQFPLFNTSDKLDEEYAMDGYSFAYVYDDFVIYDRYEELINTPLYEVLGQPKETIRIDGYDENEDLDESIIPEQVPEKLYHATFSKLLRKIKKCGYLGNSPYKLWSDSNNKYVYLATDPDEAYSYAETALDDCDNERLYDMLEDDDIVILEIDTKYLDKNKIFRDENVVDGETTYQYKGIINCQIMKIYKPTLNESVVDAMNVNGYTTYMYKNPTTKELREDKDANGEFRVVRVNDNFYFGDAGYWIHEDMSDFNNVDLDNSMRLFYDLNTNTFYKDFETIDDNKYEELYEDFVNSMQEQYILNIFPNCKFKIFSKSKINNDTPFGLV